MSDIKVHPLIDHNLMYSVQNNDIDTCIYDLPMLNEQLVGDRSLEMDVKEGYKKNYFNYVQNDHSIYHLYNFEAKTRFLDRFPNRPLFEMNTKFVLCRYVISAIDDSLEKGVVTELIAIRMNGAVFIGANKSIGSDFNTFSLAGYGGLVFADKITTGGPTGKVSIVKELRLEDTRNQTTMQIFVSSVARAFDKTGRNVELKTVDNSIGRLQNLPRGKVRGWWLRAFLSGAERVVYGLRSKDMVVEEIHEARITDFTEGHFKINGRELFKFIYETFFRVDQFLKNEGEICQIRINGNHTPLIQLVGQDFLKRSPIW